MRGGSNAAAISGLGFILLVALALRLWGLGKESLWLDEIIAATHAMQPLWRLPAEVIRRDMHPPIYFAQLAVWGWFGDSDYALLLNSVFWGVATVAVVGFAGWRLFGPAAGLIAALITAVAPGAIAASQTLRMYPFMSCVIVLVAYLYTTRIEAVAKRLDWRQLWPPALLQLLLIYTHAVGFFHVFFLGLYALILCLLLRGARADLARLLVVHVALGVVSLPVIVSSLVRSSASGVIEDAGELLRAATGILFTAFDRSGEVQQAFTLAVLILAGVLALLPGQRRRPIFWILVCAPLLMNVAISLAFKPMFKTWLFAYIVPMLALCLGAGLAEVARKYVGVASRLILWAVCTVLLGVLLWSWRGYSEASLKPNDFRGAAEMLARRAAEGDAIFAPDDAATFWAMARYLVGPRWGSPLDIQSSSPSDRWGSMKAWLPESVGRYLGLYGNTNLVMYGKIPIIVGYGRDDGATAARHDRIWVVTYDRSRGRHQVPGFPPPTHRPVETIRFKGLTVERLERSN
jgi:mannosyltransferase